jgi:cytochrome c553
MKTLIVLLSLTLTIAGFTVRADDKFEAVKASCAKCHTATTTSFPRIDGQTKEYNFQSMKDYISKARHSPASGLMAMKVKNLNDETLTNLASYFASLPPPPPIPGDAALITDGQNIYNISCASCHGVNAEGRGNKDPLNPRLAGQTKSFLKAQMINYKSGAIDNQTAMRDIAAALTDAQLAALIEFLASK